MSVPPQNTPGGLGACEAGRIAEDEPAPLWGLFQDKRRRREDVRLLLQALNNGWDPDNKSAITAALFDVLMDPDIKPRLLVRCVRALLKMDQSDQRTADIVIGLRIKRDSSLTALQRDLHAFLKCRPEQRAHARQAWFDGLATDQNRNGSACRSKAY